MNRNQLRQAGRSFAEESLSFLEGQLGEASEEVRDFLQVTAMRMARAQSAGRQDAVDAYFQQLEMLGEVQRLRANAAVWSIARKALRGFLTIAIKSATPIPL